MPSQGSPATLISILRRPSPTSATDLAGSAPDWPPVSHHGPHSKGTHDTLPHLHSVIAWPPFRLAADRSPLRVAGRVRHQRRWWRERKRRDAGRGSEGIDV